MEMQTHQSRAECETPSAVSKCINMYVDGWYSDLISQRKICVLLFIRVDIMALAGCGAALELHALQIVPKGW